MAFESGTWGSLGSWILRRPVTEPDETPFPYFAALRTNDAIFIGLSAIEIPALHFLIPWPVARTVLMVLSIWGFLWCLGMLASIIRHPHFTSEQALRLRFGSTVDVPMPWAAIGSLAPDRRFPRRGGPCRCSTHRPARLCRSRSRIRRTCA